jgi:integrase
MRLYALRHTHATLMLLQGTHRKVVSERLGHSSIVITLDTYSHMIPSMQRESAAKLDALLFKPADEEADEIRSLN